MTQAIGILDGSGNGNVDRGYIGVARLQQMDADAKRELLAHFLRKVATAEDGFELSPGQEALWFLHALAPQSAAYNVAFCIRLSSKVDNECLERSLWKLLERHPMLRSTLVQDTNGLRQRINGIPERCLELVDAYDWSEENLPSQVNSFHRRPFDLTSGPLFRATLFRRRDGRDVLLISAHHIVFDAWSLGIVLSELSALYEGADPATLAPPKASFADYVQWQRALLDSEEGREAWNYWNSRLKYIGTVDLPTDHPRPANQSFRGAAFDFTLPAAVAEQVRALGRSENATPYAVLAAAFHALLHRYSGAREVPIGTPLNGRSRPEYEDLVGYLVNPVVICAPIEPGTTFRQHLAAMREAAIAAQRYGDYPFAELVKRLQPERDSSRTPLFQVMLNLIKTRQAGVSGDVLQPQGRTGFRLGSVALDAFPLNGHETEFDLDLTLLDTGSAMPASLKYSTDLYEGATIARMAGHFLTLLSAAIESPDQPISDLPMLTELERVRLLANAEGPQLDFPRDACVHHLIERQASASPDAVAVDYRGEQITYEELNLRSNRLANYLRSIGVGPEVLVGLRLERSIDLVVGLLGILKAGGAYVPLDPQFPPDRIAFMLEDSGAAVLLTEQRLLRNLPKISGVVVCIDRDSDLIRRQGSALPFTDVAPHSLMYVIYTSGSTGKPKGVQITHASVVNFLTSMRREPGIRKGDRLLAVTTISFDIAALEIYLPLTCGACVIIAATATAADGPALARLIQSDRPNLMQATPATWRMLLESGWSGLRGLKILCGGEALSRELANRLLNASDEVWNLYGPTETTIWSAIYKVERPDAEVAIGRPIANTSCYLLDAARQPVPAGMPGELYIGGDGVARGYLNRPTLTAEKFIPSPFHAGRRLYRTGDIAVYLADGTMEFLGRLDNQVKLRGFRIEIGEIEAALERQFAVRQAVVVTRNDVRGDPRLVAYLTVRDGQEVSTEALRHALAAELPSYMLPSAFVLLDDFPLTANRKVDRKALPAPDALSTGIRHYVPPVTAAQRTIAEMWRDLLGIEEVGITDNFFELGGHSLLIAQLQRRLHEHFGADVALSEILARPTVAGIADLLGTPPAVATSEDSRWNCLVPVQRRGNRTPLFLVVGYSSRDATMLVLSRLSAHLDPDQPVYGLRPRWVNGGKTYRNVREMASECIAEMRIVQPSGPYLVGGYCFAGAVAMEIAQQLIREGEDVRLLALIDTIRPNLIRTLQIRFIEYRAYFRRRAKHVHEVIADILTAKNGSRKAIFSGLITRKLKRFSPNTYVSGISFQDLFEDHRSLLMRYRPEPYSGQISLYVSEQWYDAIVASKWRLFQGYMSWRRIAEGGLSVFKVRGDHESLTTVNSEQLARFLTGSIETALPNVCHEEDRVGVQIS